MPETPAGAVLLAVLIGVALFTGIWATQVAAESTSTIDTIDNETVNRSSDPIALAADGDRYFNETVVFASTGDQLAESEYTFDESEGTIAFNESDGRTMNVTYQTASTTEENALFITVLAPLWRIGGLLPLIGIAGAMLYGIGYLRKTAGRGGAY